uniref:Hexosyltransferase n=1 Tax=Trichobilharzia regenti TaxID=157069 RepID=A0AA85JX56_TRIRE|nr:unnamed protein product [Trichobilharzia regenti]
MIYENEFKTTVNQSFIKPINPTSFRTILSPKYSCKLPDQPNMSPQLVVFVKSALTHFESRNSIRRSWGNPNCFLHFGVHTRTLFVLGRSEFTGWEYSNIQGLVNEESSKYGDIVQFDFVESYHNVTWDVLRVPKPVRIPFSKCKPVAQLLSVGLRYTKLLPFEDVVIGLVLYKLGISPVHLDGVLSVRFSNGHIDNLISIHGFRDQSLFTSAWNELGLQNICKD